MKNMRRLAAILISILLLVQPVMASAPAAEDVRKANQGIYGLFAVTFEGYVVEATDLTSVLGLFEDGSGFFTVNNDGRAVDEWSLEGDNISIKTDEEMLTGTLMDGIIAIDYKEGGTFYYAKEGADTSGIPVMTKEEFTEAWEKAQSEDPKKAMTGTYRLTGGYFDGKEITQDVFEAMELLGLSVRLTLNEDGSAQLEYMGETLECTWEPERLNSNDENISITFENGVLTLTRGEEYLNFVKMTDDAADAEAAAGESKEKEKEEIKIGAEEYEQSAESDSDCASKDVPEAATGSIAGYYKLLKTEENGSVTDATILSSIGLEIYLVLNEDGTGKMNLFGAEMDLTWDDESISFYDEKTTYEYDDGKLTITSGGSKMYFEYAGTPEEAPGA